MSKENRAFTIDGSLGTIYAHTFEPNEITNLQITFEGRIFGEIKVSEDRKIKIFKGEIRYHHKDDPAIVLCDEDFSECPCCKNNSLTLAATAQAQPSMWWVGSYHNYYGLFCPNCWYGIDTIHRFPDAKEDMDDFKARLLKEVTDS